MHNSLMWGILRCAQDDTWLAFVFGNAAKLVAAGHDHKLRASLLGATGATGTAGSPVATLGMRKAFRGLLGVCPFRGLLGTVKSLRRLLGLLTISRSLTAAGRHHAAEAHAPNAAAAAGHLLVA